MAYAISSVLVQHEPDVVLARQRTRQIAMALGFDAQDQTRLATAVSELARNAYGYAKGGRIEFQIEGQTARRCSSFASAIRAREFPISKPFLTAATAPRPVWVWGLSARAV